MRCHPSVIYLSVLCDVMYCGETVRCRGSAIVLLDRALVSSCGLSVVTMPPSAVVRPQAGISGT